MSIDSAQMGATINSAKKNASDRQMVATVRSAVNTTGIMNRQAQRKPGTITPRRASRT